MINALCFSGIAGITIATGGSAVISESTPITIGLFVGGVGVLTAAAYFLGKTFQKGNDQREAFANDLADLKDQFGKMDVKIDKIEDRCMGCVPEAEYRKTHQISRVRPSKGGDSHTR